jgi:hypothetical protein
MHKIEMIYVQIKHITMTQSITLYFRGIIRKKEEEAEAEHKKTGSFFS